MPLDMGGSERLYEVHGPTLGYGPDIGAALKAIREHKGLALQDIVDITRIRRTYLQAIEDMRLEVLPSRPFAVGYVRAFAAALDLDAEAAVARFRDDAPPEDDTLRAPIGVGRERDPRLAAVVAGGLVVVAAIVLWNVAQRAMNRKDSEARSVAVSAPASAAPAGPVKVALGAPLPAPPEATTPAVYETPGLADAAAGDGSADAVERANKDRAAQIPNGVVAGGPSPGTPFMARGPVYGAPAGDGTVILRASRAAALIVRGEGGQVYFARQLAEGEAYRARVVKGLVADVYDPDAFEVYVGGRFTTLLPEAQTVLAKLLAAQKPADNAPGR